MSEALYGTPEAIEQRYAERGFDLDNIEQWFWVRAQWIVDLLRSGMNVAVIGESGAGKGAAMHYAEQMLAEHGLTERVWFFYEWKGSGALPRRRDPGYGDPRSGRRQSNPPRGP